MLDEILKNRGGFTHGVTEPARNLWICSMYRCADIHNALGYLTGQLNMSRVMASKNHNINCTEAESVD